MKKQSDSKHITIDQGSLMKGLEWAYDQAVEGTPLFLASAEDLGNEYREAYTAGTDSLEACARRLVLWQVTKAGASGFLSGLGGVLTLPVTIPANLASVLYVKIRMIAAIAHLGGHDLRSDQVRTLCYACMCGSATTGVIKDVGIKFGAKLAEEAIKRISGRTLTHINQKVGFRFVTKFGEKGLINLGKVIPLAGGIVGGAFDAPCGDVAGSLPVRVPQRAGVEVRGARFVRGVAFGSASVPRSRGVGHSACSASRKPRPTDTFGRPRVRRSRRPSSARPCGRFSSCRPA